MLAAAVPAILRRKAGVTRITLRGAENLKPLLAARDSVILAPNHCRMPDPLLLQSLTQRLGQPLFTMASSHLFRGNQVLAFLIRRLGAFSVFREGFDRQAIEAAIDIVSSARRPLLIFPEGALSQSNDHLNALQEGVPFIARAAAKKVARQDNDRKVYVVPVALRYLFHGDIEETVAPMLADIERRLSWRTQDQMPLVERIYRVGPALLTLKEIEHIGEAQEGSLDARLERLIDHILHPLETEWLNEPKGGSVIGRVKELRKALVPDMIESTLDQTEIDRRWRQLEDMELAQQLSLYPVGYVASKPTVDRILETVQRFIEHLSGEQPVCPPQTAIVRIGKPIKVSGKRDRSAAQDPILMAVLEESLTAMLAELSDECAIYKPAAAGESAGSN